MKFDPQTIFNLFSFGALFITGVIFVFSQIRRNDLKILRDANQDLRDSIKDKSQKIVDLTLRVDMLEKKVVVLETQNSDLQILVKEALVIYFTRYPKVAKDLNKADE